MLLVDFVLLDDILAKICNLINGKRYYSYLEYLFCFIFVIACNICIWPCFGLNLLFRLDVLFINLGLFDFYLVTFGDIICSQITRDCLWKLLFLDLESPLR